MGLHISSFGIFGVILFIFMLILILKCCLDERRTTKVTRRPHPPPGVSPSHDYQNIPYTIETYAVDTGTHLASAPPQSAVRSVDSVEVEGFVVVSDPTASPVVVPPYPVEPRHPTPQAVPPAPGFATHNPPYPTQTPHPVPGTGPYNPAAGVAPYPPVSGATPYPPAGPPGPYPDYSAQPPSYSEAISQPPVQPLPAKEAYSKQAPYNPHY